MAGLVDLTECTKQVNARLLANIGVYATTQTDSERWTTAEVQDAVIDSDGIVCAWLLQKAGDGRRVPFLQVATVAHGGVIPNHIGEIDSILLAGKMAIRSDPITIDRDRANPFGANVEYVPKIFIWGNTLCHNLTSGGATVQYADYARTGACQAPSEYSAPVIALATANVGMKNLNHSDAAQVYHTIGLSYLSPIARGEMNLAPLPTDAEVRKMMPQMGG